MTIFTVKDIKTITIPGTLDSTYIDYVEFAHKGGDTLSLDGIRVEFTCYGTVTSAFQPSIWKAAAKTADYLRAIPSESNHMIQETRYRWV